MEASSSAHDPVPPAVSAPAERAEARDKLVYVLVAAIIAVYLTLGVALYVLVAALR